MNLYWHCLNDPFSQIDVEGQTATMIGAAVGMVIWFDGKIRDRGGSSSQDKAEDSKPVRIRHYTNTPGLKGIGESGIIRAKDKGRIFAESAKRKALSPREVEEKYGLKPGYGRNYVETQVDGERVAEVYNRYTKSYELQIRGDVELKGLARFVIRNSQGTVMRVWTNHYN